MPSRSRGATRALLAAAMRPNARIRATLAGAALLALGACSGRLGSVATPGQPLAPCPSSPNCVTSESAPADVQHVMTTLAFTDAPAAAQARAKAALLAEPRTVITLEQPGYLRAEATSRLMRYVDDVEIAVDSGLGVFRFRSASRVGRSDMGVNRERMTRVLERLKGAQSVLPESLPGAWVDAPNAPGRANQKVLGDRALPGPFVERVKFPAGFSGPPHTHTQDGWVTILAGEFVVGFGTRVDSSKVVRVRAGETIRLPAGVPHFEWFPVASVEHVRSTGPMSTTRVDTTGAPIPPPPGA